MSLLLTDFGIHYRLESCEAKIAGGSDGSSEPTASKEAPGEGCEWVRDSWRCGTASIQTPATQTASLPTAAHAAATGSKLQHPESMLTSSLVLKDDSFC